MAEPSIQQSPEALEIETLRKVNTEILQKSSTRKDRIAVLEATVTELQAKLSEAGNTIKDVTISVPLKAMAASMSTCPELFLEQFSKHYKVEMVQDTLTLLSSDGKAVIDKDGKAVPFEAKALVELLTTGNDASAKVFKTITVVSHASGAASSINQAKVDKPQRMTFGLR